MRPDADRVELDVDALVERFRDGPTGALHGRLHGVDIDMSHERGELFLAVSAAAGVFAGALAQKLRTRPDGTFARLWFPVPAGIDLVVVPREERVRASDPLSTVYHVSSLVPKLAGRFLGDALPKRLIELWGRYHVTLRDEYLEVGPLDGPPGECAAVLRDLAESIPKPRLPSEHGPDAGPGPDADFDDDAVALDSFCFYCGHPVASSAATCPECDGDLTA